MNEKQQYLKSICKKIESMNKSVHIDILKIIKNDTNINISENNNGCFINMNEVSENTLNNIKCYLDFSLKNEEELKKQEDIKNSILQNILNKEIDNK